MTTELAAPTQTRPPHIPRECTRKPGSVWTNCRCDECKPHRSRMAKLHRNGKMPADHRDAAWARIQRWEAAGYTQGVVAHMTGLADRTIAPMFHAVRNGQRPNMEHRTARKILAAPLIPTSGHGWIPSLGTMRRLQALTVMGWSMRDLSERCDLQESTLAALRNPIHKMTRPRFAATVADLYAELSDTRGPGRYAAARARNRGWFPPAAWDDDAIDDPNATPDMGEETKRATGGTGRPVEDLIEDIEWLLRHDPSLTTTQLAHRLGYADKSGIQNALGPKRGNRPDLLARLNRNTEMAA